MEYKTEHLADIGQSQALLTELFSYIGENFDQNARLRDSWMHFFRLWGEQDPFVKIKVFTRRDNNILKGVVVAFVIINPLFVTKAHIHKFIDLNEQDTAFIDYVDTVLESL